MNDAVDRIDKALQSSSLIDNLGQDLCFNGLVDKELPLFGCLYQMKVTAPEGDAAISAALGEG